MNALDEYLDHLIDTIDIEDLIDCIEKEALERPRMEDRAILDGSTRRGRE